MNDILLHRVGMITILAGLILAAVAVEGTRRREDVARRNPWRIEGPPCATGEAASTGARPPKTFVYGGARFTRKFGHVWCSQFEDAAGRDVYSVCQFSSPAALQVDFAGRTHRFQTGVGKRATVTLRGAEVSCVVGGAWGAANRL